MLRRPPNWDEAKKRLADANFMQSLKEFDKEKLDDALLKKVGKFTASPDFTYDNVNKVSAAASGMCKWVHAMETYGYVAKDVAPKRAKLKAAQVRASGAPVLCGWSSFIQVLDLRSLVLC